jgi:putative flippase GtrA
MNYLPATAAAVEVAVLHNFFWHERWTWADRSHGSASGVLARLVRFEMTNGVFSIIGNLMLMRVYVGVWGLNYIIANTLAIVSCSIVNFIAGDRLVYRQAAGPARVSHRISGRGEEDGHGCKAPTPDAALEAQGEMHARNKAIVLEGTYEDRNFRRNEDSHCDVACLLLDGPGRRALRR